MTDLRVGQRVHVLDEGLAQLRAVMRRAIGSEPKPNHHGTVAELWDDGETVLIDFYDGVAAPYPIAIVREERDRPRLDFELSAEGRE